MPSATEARFVEVYRACYPDVLRFVRRRAHPMNVDDIVGETFLAAWRRRGDLPADPRPWLFGTARNVMLNAQRQSRRQAALAVRIRQTADAGTVDTMSQTDGHLDLVAAWRELSAADQEVLALHVWEGLTAEAAGAVIGCSRAAYAMRLSRARRRLARLLHTTYAATPATAPTN